MVDQSVCAYCSQVHPTDTQTCPNTDQALLCSLCEYVLPYMAEECPNCGTLIVRPVPAVVEEAVPLPEPVQPEPEDLSPADHTDWPLCPKCKSPHPPQAKFCPECGKSLIQKEKTPKPARQRKPIRVKESVEIPAAAGIESPEVETPAVEQEVPSDLIPSINITENAVLQESIIALINNQPAGPSEPDLEATLLQAAPEVEKITTEKQPVPQPEQPIIPPSEELAENISQQIAQVKEQIDQKRSQAASLQTRLDNSEKAAKISALKADLIRRTTAGSQRQGWGFALLGVTVLFIILMASDSLGISSDFSGLCWSVIVIAGVVGMVLALSKGNNSQELVSLNKQLANLGFSSFAQDLYATQADLRKKQTLIKIDLQKKEQDLAALLQMSSSHTKAMANAGAASEIHSEAQVASPLPGIAGIPTTFPWFREAKPDKLLKLRARFGEIKAGLDHAERNAEILQNLKILESKVESVTTRRGWGWFLVGACVLLGILVSGNAFDLGEITGFCWAGVIIIFIVGLVLAFSGSFVKKDLAALKITIQQNHLPTNPDLVVQAIKRMRQDLENCRHEIDQEEKNQVDHEKTVEEKKAIPLGVSEIVQMHSAVSDGSMFSKPAAETEANLIREKRDALFSQQRVVINKIDQADQAISLLAKREDYIRRASANAVRRIWGWIIFAVSIIAVLVVAGDYFHLGSTTGPCLAGIIIVGLVGFILATSASSFKEERELINRKLARLNLPVSLDSINHHRSLLRSEKDKLQKEIDTLQQKL